MSEDTQAPAEAEAAPVVEVEHPVASHNRNRFLAAVAERGLELESLTLHEVSEVARLAKVCGVSVRAKIEV